MIKKKEYKLNNKILKIPQDGLRSFFNANRYSGIIYLLKSFISHPGGLCAILGYISNPYLWLLYLYIYYILSYVCCISLIICRSINDYIYNGIQSILTGLYTYYASRYLILLFNLI